MPRIICFALLLIFVLSLCLYADGCYVPKARLAPGTEALDITEPEQKAFICHQDGRERMILQVSYKGNASEFCWLVPTPSRPDIETVDAAVFHALHQETAPRLKYKFNADKYVDYLLAGGYLMAHAKGITTKPLKVDVLERKPVGVYDITVLKAQDANDLLVWLKTNGYQANTKLKTILEDYIRRGWVFSAMKVRPNYQKQSQEALHDGVLESVRFNFDSNEPVYPLKISSVNPGKTSVLIYAITDRVVAANGMKQVCSIEINRESRRAIYRNFGPIGIAPLANMFTPGSYITKLSAQFSPEQMTSDIVLRPAKNNHPTGRIYVPASFLDNVRMSTVAGLMALTATPASLSILLPCFLLGRKKTPARIACRNVGLVYVAFSIFSTYFLMIFGYRFATITMLLVTGFVAMSNYKYIRRARKSS